jgi:hypothetical protein
MAAGFNPKIVTKNLVFCLDAGNRKSLPNTTDTETWKDLITGENALTLDASYSSAFLGSIIYDGSNTNTEIPTGSVTIPGGNQITISTWAKASTGIIIFFSGYDSSDNVQIEIYLPFNDDVWWIAGGDELQPGWTVDAEWHYWTFTKNASTGSMKIYLDGNLLDSGTAKTGAIGTIATSHLGHSLPNDAYFAGQIALFSIYDQELTSEEVKQNFNATRGRFKI